MTGVPRIEAEDDLQDWDGYFREEAPAPAPAPKDPKDE